MSVIIEDMIMDVPILKGVFGINMIGKTCDIILEKKDSIVTIKGLDVTSCKKNEGLILGKSKKKGNVFVKLNPKSLYLDKLFDNVGAISIKHIKE